MTTLHLLGFHQRVAFLTSEIGDVDDSKGIGCLDPNLFAHCHGSHALLCFEHGQRTVQPAKIINLSHIIAQYLFLMTS